LHYELISLVFTSFSYDTSFFPPIYEYLERLGRAAEISRSAFEGIAIKMKESVNTDMGEVVAGLDQALLSSNELGPTSFYILGKIRLLQSLRQIGRDKYIWLHLLVNLNHFLNFGQPTSSVYRLVQEMVRYFSSIRDPIQSGLMQTNDLDSIAQIILDNPQSSRNERQQAQLLKLFASEMVIFNDVVKDMDLFDVNSVRQAYTHISTATRTSMFVDFCDMLRIYVLLFPIVSLNTDFVESLRTQIGPQSTGEAITRLLNTNDQSKLIQISAIYWEIYVEKVLSSPLLLVNWEEVAEPMWKNKHPGSSLAEVRAFVQHNFVVLSWNAILTLASETLMKMSKVDLVFAVPEAGRRPALTSPEEGTTSTSNTLAVPYFVQDNMDTVEEIIADTESDDNETVIEDEQPDSSRPERDEIAGEVSEQQEPKEKLVKHAVCDHIRSGTYLYIEPDFFWRPRRERRSKKKKATIKAEELQELSIDARDMKVLCQLKGALRGGPNVTWRAFLKIVQTLHGTVRRSSGSAHTVFVPTRNAYPIRIDEPHPSNRLGRGTLQAVREVLFQKFGVDLDKFVPV
jgi:hypothetical protein